MARAAVRAEHEVSSPIRHVVERDGGERLEELGVTLESEADVNAAFARFKDLADRKAEIFDEDIMQIVSEESAEAQAKEHFRFVSMKQHSETGEQPQAKVVFAVEGTEVTGEARGNGPVDATLHAIESKVESGAELVLYSVNAITTGTQALLHCGIEARWLTDPALIMPAIVIASLWLWVGFNMVYFLAALQTVDRSLEEAARIDGASAWQVFWHVTLPLLRPYILVALLLRTIFEFRAFDNIYVMTSGGPANATMSLSMFTYLASFVKFDLSLGAAASWMMLVMCLSLCLFFIAVIRRREAN